MVELLALIGLGWLVHKLAKGLQKAGNKVTGFSDDLSDYIVAQKHTKRFDPQENTKLAKKVEGIKGDESDEMYQRKVQEEIDRITQ